MPIGTIKTIRDDRGFGFITPDSGRGSSEDLFFHASAVEGTTFEELQEGQQVTFEQEPDDRNPRRQRAVRVRPATDAS
jgi:CspA family cold shock protein